VKNARRDTMLQIQLEEVVKRNSALPSMRDSIRLEFVKIVLLTSTLMPIKEGLVFKRIVSILNI